jgi:hypothetical protein
MNELNTTFVDLAPRVAWQPGEPPHDREVIITGNLVYRGSVESWAEPVCCRAVWLADAVIPGWHFADNRLAISQSYGDELVIHFWSELPWVDPELGEAVGRIEREWEGRAL